MDHNFKIAVRRFGIENLMSSTVISSANRECGKYYKDVTGIEASLFKSSRVRVLRDNYRSLKEEGVSDEAITNVANYIAQKCARLIVSNIREGADLNITPTNKMEKIAKDLAIEYVAKRNSEKQSNASSIAGALKQCAMEIKDCINS